MKTLLAAIVLGTALTPLQAQTPSLGFTVVSRVMEANPRVVALAIDVGKDLPINWTLENAFSVQAELLPVKTYTGDPIANSAAARAPRTIRKAYTSARPEIGSPSQGRYVIIEMDPDDANGSSWYAGFNPGIRQMIPYQDKMVYDVKLLRPLNYLVPPASATVPGAAVATLQPDAVFKQAGTRLLSAEGFGQGVFEQPANRDIQRIAYNLHKPAGLAAGAKVPLVVFLHGSGQSHDHVNHANDLAADVLSPLLANQGGVAWVERAPEKAFVLVPQVPARDKRDAQGEAGWRSADTQALLLGLVDQVVADNPAIDVNRLYLTGLSLGAMGTWKVVTHPNPAVSRKFAAAVLLNGTPLNLFVQVPDETPAQRQARHVAELQAMDFSAVRIPLWLANSNTDPLVNVAGTRIPFARLTGAATVDAAGALQANEGTLKSATVIARHYAAANRAG